MYVVPASFRSHFDGFSLIQFLSASDLPYTDSYYSDYYHWVLLA